MRVLSLFTGAGGLDIGLERAGFRVSRALEIDTDCRKTLQANRPNWKQLEPGDIHSHRPRDLAAAAGFGGDGVTLVAGGPPCQPFSKSGQWRVEADRRMSDPRAATLRAFLAVIDAGLPDFVLLENVRGITATRSRVTQKYEAFDVLRSEFQRINRRRGTRYEIVPLVTDAADYGVPQRRQRVFVFAARDGAALELPQVTHGSAAGCVQRHATAWDALWDLDDPDYDLSLRPTGIWADLLPSIPEGCNYLFHTDRGDGEPLFGWRRRYWSFLLKLAKNRPSWTVQAQAGPATGPFHWRSRRLSVAELARLQCFPSDWDFKGSVASGRRQVGNAVPPPLGEMLGLEIRRQLLGQRPRRPSQSLIPQLRSECGPPETPTPVPERFLSMRGEAEAHPGAGLGPGAKRSLDVSVQQN